MHPLDLRFQKSLLFRIHERGEDEAELIASGSCPDYAEYRDRCAYLRALQDVKTWCEDVQRELSDDGSSGLRKAR